MAAGTVQVLVVVEDEPDMRLLIRTMLERDPRLELLGEASSATEALEVLDSIDAAALGLIVLDHSIEGEVMGLELAPLLKAKAPSAKILLFTAYDMAGEAKAEPAVDAYLRKDNIARLLVTVQRLLHLDAS